MKKISYLLTTLVAMMIMLLAVNAFGATLTSTSILDTNTDATTKAATKKAHDSGWALAGEELTIAVRLNSAKTITSLGIKIELSDDVTYVNDSAAWKLSDLSINYPYDYKDDVIYGACALKISSDATKGSATITPQSISGEVYTFKVKVKSDAVSGTTLGDIVKVTLDGKNASTSVFTDTSELSIKKVVDALTNASMAKIGGVWYYLESGVIKKDYTGYANYGSGRYWIVDGKKASTYTGVNADDGNRYYENGLWQGSKNGIVKDGGVVYNVTNGIASKLSSIAVSTKPTKVSYLEGSEDLNLVGGKLLLTFEDGSTQIINLGDESATTTEFDNTVVGTQTLTVTYGGKTATFEVTVVPKSFNSIIVSTKPTKLSYLEAKDALDLTGGELTLIYDDDAAEVIKLSEAQVTGFDNTVVGEQTLTVTYGDKTTTFDVTITAKSLSSIAVSTNPTKTSYLEGKDSLDLTGGKLTLTYDNDTTDIIDLSEAEVTGFNNKKTGKQTLTVTYEGKTTTFAVTITAKSLSSIAISTKPTKLTYIKDKENLNLAGGKLKLTYNNGTTAIIDLSKAKVTGFNKAKVGSQTLTVTYGGKTTKFAVTVVKTGLYKEGSVYKYYKNNVLQKINGLSKVDGTWRYYKNGVWQSSYNGTAIYKNVCYTVQKGLLKAKYSGLSKASGTWRYYKKGVWQSKYTGFINLNKNARYRVEKGVINFKRTAILKDGSSYRYYKNGKWQSSFSGKVKISGKTYTIKKGIKK